MPGSDLQDLPHGAFVVTGHRGAAGLEPENTLRSFRRACELGVTRVETDVRLTRDGVLVCMHDATVDRTTNGTGAMDSLSFDELRVLDAGKGEKAPTLAEALEVVKGFAVLEIELKGEGTGLPTVQVLQAAGVTAEDVLLISFDASRLQEVGGLRPDIARKILYSRLPDDWITQAQAIGAGVIGLHYHSVSSTIVEAAHHAGLTIEAWTPNTRAEMETLIALGVDGIASDRPDILLDCLRQNASPTPPPYIPG